MCGPGAWIGPKRDSKEEYTGDSDPIFSCMVPRLIFNRLKMMKGLHPLGDALEGRS